MNTENIPVKIITDELLDDITQRLVSALNPEQVILFGSYAYGEPTEDSDIDLLVIISDSDEPRYRRARQAYKALHGISIPKDILVMTRAEVERKATVASSLVSQALSQGKILYG
jgi:predicted nucleotidyltransferase